MTIVLPVLLLTYLMFHGTQLIALHPMILSHETRSLFIIALLPGSSQAPPKLSSHTAQVCIAVHDKVREEDRNETTSKQDAVSFPDLICMYIASSIMCITESNLHLGWFGYGTETKQNAPLLLVNSWD